MAVCMDEAVNLSHNSINVNGAIRPVAVWTRAFVITDKPLPQGAPGGIIGIVGGVIAAVLIIGVAVTVFIVYRRQQKNRTEADDDLTDLPPSHKPAPPPKRKQEMKSHLTAEDIQVVHLDNMKYEEEIQKLPLQTPYYDMGAGEPSPYSDKLMLSSDPARKHRGYMIYSFHAENLPLPSGHLLKGRIETDFKPHSSPKSSLAGHPQGDSCPLCRAGHVRSGLVTQSSDLHPCWRRPSRVCNHPAKLTLAHVILGPFPSDSGLKNEDQGLRRRNEREWTNFGKCHSEISNASDYLTRCYSHEDRYLEKIPRVYTPLSDLPQDLYPHHSDISFCCPPPGSRAPYICPKEQYV
ncbi:uncharacterized protein [Struthio camelus]|uniref:uncharacterized protein n=1 Tax=Struthio camelus TaxID=8801 RepID=UPI003603EA99